MAPLLLGAVTLATGCDDAEDLNDIEIHELELRAEAEPLELPISPTGDLELREDQIDAPGQDKIANVGPDKIEGQYIVLMQKGANPHAAAAAVAATPNHVFSHVISGFAGPLNRGQLEGLARRPDVVLIEPDQVVTMADNGCLSASSTTQEKSDNLYYGVDRIDERSLPLSGSYTYKCTGSGVHVYVFDTGIHTSHSDFADLDKPNKSRADVKYDAFPQDGWNGEDCNGHGTHVSGIIGGLHYGVAKDAYLHSIKVLGCDGHGSWSKLLAGMDWVEQYGSKPAVANMSLSGSDSRIVDFAVNNLVDSGVLVVVAAGNSNKNACSYSPAGASKVITVAANNSLDQRASFSNYGSCVDIYAPGTNIKSAWLDGGSRTASGTSMASPHVAGVAALYKEGIGDSEPSSQIKSMIESFATPDIIEGNPSNTANLLIHWPYSGSTDP